MHINAVASAAGRTGTRGWHRLLGRVLDSGWHRPLGEHALVVASAAEASTEFWLASAAVIARRRSSHFVNVRDIIGVRQCSGWH